MKNKRFAYTVLLAVLVASPMTMGTARAGDLPDDWEDRIKLGVKAYEKGENRVAFDMFYKLMSEGARKLGPSDGRLVRIYTNMGELYDAEEQFNYAEDCLKKGLNIAQKGYGSNSVQCLAPLIDLGQTYVHQSKDSLAAPLFQQAISIVDKANDPALVPYAAVAETNLGAMYYAEGNYGAGETHLKRALELANQSLGANHKWSTTIGGMYASCMRANGKNKEAKAIEQAAVQKANEIQSPMGVWHRQMRVADEAIAAKKYTEAETALKAATLASQELTAEPMVQALTMSKYGELFLLQNKPEAAIEKWKASQAIADSILGADDKSVLEHARLLADLEKKHSRYADAEPLYVRLTANVKKQFGPDSEEYAKNLTDMAEFYTNWAQYPKAVSNYSKLLTWQEKKYGPDSEKLIPVLVALGNTSQNNTTHFTEVNQKAEDYLNRAMAIATKKCGKNSKEVADVLDALSHYYQRHFDWEKAKKACSQVVAVDEKTFGPDSAETVKALQRYAIVLRAAGLREEAEPIEARIAKIKGVKSGSTEED